MEKQRIIELFEAFREGDEEAFNKLYSTLYSRQHYIAARILHDEYAAEDIVQETFLKIYRKKDDLKDVAALLVWINRITYNSCVNYIVKNNPSDTSSAAEPLDNYRDMLQDEREENNPVRHVEKREQRDMLLSALDKLNEGLKIVILLKYFNGMKEKEIAEVLECPVGTVKSRLHTAKRQLSGSLVGIYSIAPLFLVHMVLAEEASSAGSTHLLTSAIGKRVAIGTATAVTVVGAAAIAAGPAPRIAAVSATDPAPYVRSQRMKIDIASAQLPGELRVYGDGILLEHDGPSAFMDVWENGSYKVTVVDSLGRKAEETFAIENIDISVPECVVQETTDHYVRLLVTDSGSGVDWDSFLAENDAGERVEPTVVDRRRGILEYSLAKVPGWLRISDQAGNWTKFEVNLEEEEEDGDGDKRRP